MFNADEVKKRLESFGYNAAASDEFAIVFAVEKVKNTIKNDTNLADVPDGLENIAVDMAAGDFLRLKKTAEPDALTNIDLSSAIKQIQEGDTSTTFAVGDGSLTPEQRLNAFIDYLCTYGRDEFSRYRRLRW